MSFAEVSFLVWQAIWHRAKLPLIDKEYLSEERDSCPFLEGVGRDSPELKYSVILLLSLCPREVEYSHVWLEGE